MKIIFVFICGQDIPFLCGTITLYELPRAPTSICNLFADRYHLSVPTKRVVKGGFVMTRRFLVLLLLPDSERMIDLARSFRRGLRRALFEYRDTRRHHPPGPQQKLHRHLCSFFLITAVVLGFYGCGDDATTAEDSPDGGAGEDVEDCRTLGCPSSDQECNEIGGSYHCQYYEGCHYDCFGGATCRDGVVFQHSRGARPCGPGVDYSNACGEPREVYRCEEGCALSSSTYAPIGSEAHDLCNEFQRAAEGDLCESDSDCTGNAVDIDGERVTTYLRCEGATPSEPGTCVLTDPPEIADFLATCSLTEASEARPVYTSECSGDICLTEWDEEAGCLRQGCSKSCNFDSECPLGAFCEDSYCEPGPTLAGLTCPSTGE